MRTWTWTWTLTAVVAAAPPGAAQNTVEFSGRTWTTTDPDAVVEEYLGEEALRLRSGAAILSDVTFQNGTIEYDVATTGHRSFVGVAFRIRESPRVAYEHFYLRPHQTGRFDASQYTPEINGLAAWQLYPEYNAAVEIPADRWIHVRIVVSGRRMEAWVGEREDPVLVVNDLRLQEGPGSVGLTSNFPQAAALDLYPTAYANVRITPAGGGAGSTRAERSRETPPEIAPGTVTRWALSASVPGEPGPVTTLDRGLLDGLEWDVVPTDPAGRVNVAQFRAFPEDARQGRVYARIVLHAEEAKLVPLGFGFSDRGSVFLNGRLLLTADNTYLTRSGRYLGVMTVDSDILYLPLEAGPNELIVAVTEAFGGWGLVARLGDPTGVRVTAEPPRRR